MDQKWLAGVFGLGKWIDILPPAVIEKWIGSSADMTKSSLVTLKLFA